MRVDYCEDDIVESLKEIGIGPGDHIFLHANLGYFGMCEGCTSGDDLCECFIKAMNKVVGASGSLITPTFSYSYCNGEVYNPELSKTTCGMLSDYFIRKYSENRTLDPNFSVCILGAGVDYYLGSNIHESFGQDSFWERFMNKNGKFVCMNIDASTTFVHFIERAKGVPYRYNKAFNGVTNIKGIETRDYAVHYVFDGEDDYPCYTRMSEVAFDAGIVLKTNLGRGSVLSFKARDYYDLFYDLLDVRPRVLCRKE